MTSDTDTRDIHTHFGLSYANYLVLHRTLLQSMPAEWQHRFVTMLEQLDTAFAHIEHAETYEVTAGVEREVEELTDAELAYLGITRPDGTSGDEEEDELPEHFGDEYYLKDGTAIQGWMRVVWPTSDPVPHYNRGRTFIEPSLP